MFTNLPDAPLDIIGDVHGELDALKALLHHLGYDEQGHHKGGRHLVFVGDLCDRGPDSVGVINLVRRIIESGRGNAILGNHELNLLRSERKDGNNWFWGEESKRDVKYEPYHRVTDQQRNEILNFIGSLPLALERDDIRIVHAAWHSPSLEQIRAVSENHSVTSLFGHWENEIESQLLTQGLLARAKVEKEEWQHALHDQTISVPLLSAIGACDEVRQMGNPLRVLLSGIERLGTAPFFSSGKWRFAERVQWWNEYQDKTPVVIGHYWRRFVPFDREKLGKGDPDLFQTIGEAEWHGVNNNVFCVDYSVGGRFQERRLNQSIGQTTKLAALRWPERSLMLDTGEQVNTLGFNAK